MKITCKTIFQVLVQKHVKKLNIETQGCVNHNILKSENDCNLEFAEEIEKKDSEISKYKRKVKQMQLEIQQLGFNFINIYCYRMKGINN